MNLHRLFLITVLSFASSHLALGDKPSTEAQLTKLVQQSPKTYLPELIALKERELKQVYEAALKDRDPTYQAALQKSQAAWEAFANADCRVEAIDSAGGSDAAVFTMERKLYQIRLRMYQLQTPFEAGWVEIPK